MDVRAYDRANPPADIAPHDLAYMMYTSGSTGQPKGVQIEHRALAAYCYADIDIYELTAHDRTLQFSTLSFDIAIEEIFPPLMMGGTVVVRPRARSSSENELLAIIQTYGVTAIHLATAYWHEWVDLMVASGTRIPDSLRLMVVTGEKVSAQHYQRWRTLCDHPVLWCNAYGPTEATVSATVFIPPDDWEGDNLPIGKPLKRYTAYLLDESQQQVEADATGELYLGGPALARGYHLRDDLTARAFVELTLDNGKVERLYKTGDLCRWLPTGDLEFGGRIDHQIKLGSFRIEPGEIEAALNQQASVLESLVTYEEIEGKKFLVAYVSHGDADCNVARLSDGLRERLPAYMVPSRYVRLSAFPKTINGKIDRDQLPPPSTAIAARSEGVVAARTPLETQLVSLWREVLNVPEIGIHDDFFALGGSSLLVTRVITQIKTTLDAEIPVRDFFANPTIASIARHLQSLSGESAESIDDAERARYRDQLPRIAVTYFQSGASSCFGVHYPPTATAPKSLRHAVLFCPPHGHEYVRSHRNLQQMAVQLAQHGFDVFRFDYVGTGNSQGDTLQIPQALEDIAAAQRWIRDAVNVDQVSVLGLRLGATLLSQVDTSGFSRVVFWDPIFQGQAYLTLLQKFHRTALTNLWRYPVIRTAQPDQLYGNACPPAWCRDVGRLQLVPTASSDSTLLLLSRGYLEAEDTAQAIDPNRFGAVAQTDDEIYWHEEHFTTSAFSSPQAFQIIRHMLTQGHARWKHR